MKLYFIILFSFCLSHLHAQVTHTVNFSREELTLSDVVGDDSNLYTQVSYSDLQPTEELANPELPVKYIRLIIPNDQKLAEINLSFAERDTIGLSHWIYPKQPPTPTSIGFGGYEFIAPDEETYRSQNPFPIDLVKLSSDGYFDGINHIISLAVCPVQYYPLQNKLIFYSSIQITLSLQPSNPPLLNVITRIASNQTMYDNVLEEQASGRVPLERLD